jgi:hypothetical protein
MKRKSLIVAAAVATLGVAGTTGLSIANAATDTSSDPTSSLVQKIADKFKLNKSDVQAVFDEQRSEMEAKHEQEVKDNLTQAVTDGKITQDQADKITAKLKEIQTNRDAMKDKTVTERQQARQQNRDDMKQWAQDNGISLDTLRSIIGRPHGPGPNAGADTNN